MWAKLLRRGALAVVIAIGLLVVLVPAEFVGVMPRSDLPDRGGAEATVQQVLNSERYIDDIAPGTEKAVVWALPERERTPLAVVHIHGFAGSRGEASPMPETVAAALGANLFQTRLSGHGRGPAALGRARVEHWLLDTAEAMAVGRALGERVLLIGSDIGATLAGFAALEPSAREGLAGVVMIAPNFGLSAPGNWALRLPFARDLAPRILDEGPGRGSHVATEEGGTWTVRRPVSALVPVGALGESAFAADWRAAVDPALFLWSEDDRIVSPERIAEVAGRWGGEATTTRLLVGPQDDPDAHVLAGDAASPDLSPFVTRVIIDWARAEGIAPEVELEIDGVDDADAPTNDPTADARAPTGD